MPVQACLTIMNGGPDLANQPVSLPLIARPKKSAWALFWLYLAIVVFHVIGFVYLALEAPGSPFVRGHYSASPSHHAWTVRDSITFVACFGGGFILFLCGLVYLWLMIRKGHITADRSGLTYWTVIGDKFVAWHEITDYYEPAYSQKPRCFVESRHGKFDISGTYWEYYETLRTVIQQNATNAEATAWATKGNRDFDDWPKVLTNANVQKFSKVCPAIAVACFSGLIWSTWSSPGRWTPTSFDLGTGTKGIVLNLFCFTAFLLVPLCPALLIYAIRPRNCTKQIFTCTRTAFTLSEEDRSFSAKWSEVLSSDYINERKNPHAIIVLRTGKGEARLKLPFDNSSKLTGLIRDLTGHPEWPLWPRGNDDPIGGEASRWSGSKIGEGHRIFHYRNRMNRALALFPCAYPAAFCIVILVNYFFNVDNEKSHSPHWGLAVGFAVLCVLFYLNTVRTEIHVSSDGILKKRILGQIFIPWDDVASIESFQEVGAIRIIGKASKLHFWTNIVDRRELLDEITRRIPRAVAERAIAQGDLAQGDI